MIQQNTPPPKEGIFEKMLVLYCAEDTTLSQFLWPRIYLGSRKISWKNNRAILDGGLGISVHGDLGSIAKVARSTK